jgi:DNA-binding protein YbaB
MSAPMQDQMEAALAELRAQQEKISEFSAAMAARTTEVTSKNRMISAKVDSQGKLVELSFKGNRYRQIAPAELGTLVVETVAKAQDIATKETMEAAAALMPEGMGLPGAAGRDVDGMFEAAMRLAEEPLFLDEGTGRESNEVRDV